MRHYFGATPDGRLYWTFTMAGGYDGTGVDLDAESPQDAHAQHLLNVYNKNMRADETLDCILVYECPCPPGNMDVCGCPPKKRVASYCVGGVLTDKPTCELLLDGVVVEGDNITLSRYPNSLFTLQLREVVADSIPDAEVVNVFSSTMLEAGQADITFTNGSTNILTLRAPAQGTVGYISTIGRMICHHSLYIKGFASTPS